MKPYLVTTGLLFAVLAVLHVWRAIAEWPQPGPSAGFLVGMAALIIVPGALSWWAWSLVCTLSSGKTDGAKYKPGP